MPCRLLRLLAVAFVLGGILLATPADARVPASARRRIPAAPERKQAVATVQAPGRAAPPVLPRRRLRPAGAIPAPIDAATEWQQALARLGYLPVRWSVRAQGFEWLWRHVPAPLARLWTPGTYNLLTQGAAIQFLRVNHLRITRNPGPAFLRLLDRAWRQHRLDPYPYTYVEVGERRPETLRIWEAGRVVFTASANTGQAPTTTATGTFPVYLRYGSQPMRGTEPDGKPYYYPHVLWVSYFHGGDAIHAFPRASYGFPQSAGCVELPPAAAQEAWKLIHYGTLVTVVPAAGSRRT